MSWILLLALFLQAGPAHATCTADEYKLLALQARLASPEIAPSPEVITLGLKGRKVQKVEDFLARKELTLLTTNAENYFVVEDPEAKSTLKPIPARNAVALRIAKEGADVVSVQEMGGKKGLDDLVERVNAQIANKDDHYIGLLVKGNDGRGIELCVMVKASLPLEFEYSSHRYEPMLLDAYPGRERAFSRDQPALIARLKGEKDPLFIVLPVHKKSKITERPEDPLGTKLRAEESRAAAKLIQHFETEYPGVPIFQGGDFNGAVHKDPEFERLRETGMKDAHDLVPEEKRIPPDDSRRTTYVWFPPEGGRVENQLDAWMVNGNGDKFVSEVITNNFIDPRGAEIPLPQTKEDAEKLKTDHRSITMKIDFQKLLEARRNQGAK